MNKVEYQSFMERMLEEGVPPGVVCRVMDADQDYVKETQREVRVRKYGTDDLNDYVEQMQWDAVEVARNILATGSPAEQSRYVSAILGKQMTAAAKRTPQGERDQAAKVLEMFEDMKKG